MSRSKILLFGRPFTAWSELATALNASEADLVMVSSEPELLALAARGVGRAAIVDGERIGTAEKLRALRSDLLVLVTPGRLRMNETTEVGGLLVGSSAAIRRVREYTAKVAATDCNVVVTGETGTGKELVAQALHRDSRRASKPLMAVNCAAIPDALFETELFGHERGAFTGAVTTRVGKLQQADGGTVFLDELEELSPMAQAKLLRAIETREVERLGGRGAFKVNVRMISASNQDLGQLMEAGRFRKDLYYRLAVTHSYVPPLRERREDIAGLAAHFLGQINREFGLALGALRADAVEALQEHNWPGNVRELRNVLEAIAVEKQTGEIGRADLPPWFRPQRQTVVAGPPEERYRMMEALASTRGNKAEAARQLNWSRMTLYRKMAKHQVEAGPKKKAPMSVTAGPRTAPAQTS